jgi:hypothetical protein
VVCNVGADTASNCKIRIVAHQSGGVLAMNTPITLDSIAGESSKNVDTNIYYSGTALIDTNTTLEWTS